MELFFEGGDGRDFKAVCDLPDYLKALDPDGERGGYVCFQAFDTSFDADYPIDRLLLENEFEFDCEVRVWFDDGNDIYLHSFAAHDKQEAKRLLQVAADALYR